MKKLITIETTRSDCWISSEPDAARRSLESLRGPLASDAVVVRRKSCAGRCCHPDHLRLAGEAEPKKQDNSPGAQRARAIYESSLPVHIIADMWDVHPNEVRDIKAGGHSRITEGLVKGESRQVAKRKAVPKPIRTFIYRGKSYRISELAALAKPQVHAMTMRKRLEYLSPEEAVNYQPPAQQTRANLGGATRGRKATVTYPYKGREMSATELAELAIPGLDAQVIRQRLGAGWEVDKALTTPLRDKRLTKPEPSSSG